LPSDERHPVSLSAGGRFARAGLEVHRVASSHLAMLERPDVDDLARILRSCIARATSKD
jgi:thioesterase domain-containing protein